MKPSEFARHLGVVPSYVNKLRAQGRLVLTDGGLIDVDASIAGLEATRGGQLSLEASIPASLSVWSLAESDYQVARARREHSQALLKEMECSKLAASLVQASGVQTAIAEAETIIRETLSSLPDAVVGKIAATEDEQEILFILENAVDAALGTLATRFKQMARQSMGPH